VYAVRWQEKEVALKLPQADLGERDRTHFLREAALLQKAKHTGVVEVLDAGTLSDGRPYLVMPLLEGVSLAELIKRRGKLALDEALGLFLPLAEAVAHLHALGLAHRDIKPENVYYLETEKRLLLLDFGIARETDKPPSTTTQANIVRGTPATMAPERFFGARATATSDAYELALVLYAMLTGALPWGESTDASERLSPKSPSELGVSVPEAVESAILEALSTRPERRPSVRALIDRLSAQTPTSSTQSARTTVATTPPPPASAPDPERVTKALSVAPPDRTTAASAHAPPSKSSPFLLVGAVVAALGVGAFVARAWPTASASSAANSVTTTTPTAPASASAQTTETVAALPTASATAEGASAPTASAARGASAKPADSAVARSGSAAPTSSASTGPAPSMSGSACHQLRVFNCSHNTSVSEIGCKHLGDGTLEESYTAAQEANCRASLDSLRAANAAPLPADSESGLEYCARLRDAYCSPELSGLWPAKTLCAQGQALYQQNRARQGQARVEANNTCAQMLPGLVQTLKKDYEGTSPPPGFTNP